MIKRPELTDEEKREAEALKKIWDKKKKELRERGIKLTQESAAEELGFDTQGAVSQYLNGKIRLNLDAIIKFSKLLGCKPNDIRPSLDILVDETARPRSPIAIDKDKTHLNESALASDAEALADLPEEAKKLIHNLINLSSSGEIDKKSIEILQIMTDKLKK
ncbi:helix-turn-helix domain-containing protein [Methylobacter marinus]|uniref:helix-turn-helix domain-containing protein n=1 Tax=Methylobacter marinus TaxID=34058 RepID=UPI000368A9D3|nr:helix-turn-helix transcriptional regulator [Methylobacter marinus]